MSRALRSLERKGLVVRCVNRPTGQLLVTLTASAGLPPWEIDARADEAFASRCDAVASQLAELGRRARHRAGRPRLERDVDLAELERLPDVASWRELMSAGAAPDQPGVTGRAVSRPSAIASRAASLPI